ncbi:PPC domain-containing protein [Candidatus Woesearchaeota archaeon]|nr:PPC domain-containing protein [Candidatus Woesearchaeota archaeon]
MKKLNLFLITIAIIILLGIIFLISSISLYNPPAEVKNLEYEEKIPENFTFLKEAIGQDLPKELSTILENEKINFYMPSDNEKGSVFSIVTEENKVKNIDERKNENPSIEVYASEEIINEMINSENIAEDFQNALNTKKISISGIGLKNKIKFSSIFMLGRLLKLTDLLPKGNIPVQIGGNRNIIEVPRDNIPEEPQTWAGIRESGNVLKSGEKRYQTPALSSGSYIFTLSGSGDSDLYIRKLSPPTLSEYDCRPNLPTSNEECIIDLENSGIIHIMIKGYDTNSDYVLVGRPI